jgi:Cdc6-like AAA superfamily ATPase
MWAEALSISPKQPRHKAFRPVPLTPNINLRDFSIPFRFDVRNGKFTGRTALLNRIHRTFRGEMRSSLFTIVALYGPGGIGKTQIAMEYANLHHVNYSSVFWIDGTNHRSACQSFLQIANRLLKHYADMELGATTYGSLAARLGLIDLVDEKGHLSAVYGDGLVVVEAIKNWFAEEGNTEWLLIFDNVDDLDAFDIRDFFPKTSWGSILLTSRRRDVSVAWIGIEVGDMSEDEGLRLLKKSANLDQHLSQEGKVSQSSCEIHMF